MQTFQNFFDAGIIVSRPADALPNLGVGSSAFGIAVDLPDWSSAWPNVRFSGSGWTASRQVHVIKNMTLTGPGGTNVPKSSVVQIPAGVCDSEREGVGSTCRGREEEGKIGKEEAEVEDGD